MKLDESDRKRFERDRHIQRPPTNHGPIITGLGGRSWSLWSDEDSSMDGIDSSWELPDFLSGGDPIISLRLIRRYRTLGPVAGMVHGGYHEASGEDTRFWVIRKAMGPNILGTKAELGGWRIGFPRFHAPEPWSTTQRKGGRISD